ncbi:MAG TPA: Ig-like domain-containing protein, partial [Turneriella sp.]|nr:Ig-like domain-containing protein [Turneriella sp.]
MLRDRTIQYLLLSGFSALMLNCSGKTYSTFFQPFDLLFNRSSTSLSMVSATPLTNTRVMLTYSKAIDFDSAVNPANYTVKGPDGNLLHIMAVSRDPNNANVIFVDTAPQSAGKEYTVTASNIKGVDGTPLGGSNSAKFTAPNNADQMGPQFSQVTAVNGTTLEVYFNEAMDKTSAETAANYDIYTDAACSSGNVNVTGAVRDTSNIAKVTLISASMTAGTTYYLCATNAVKDMWGNANAATIASQPFVYSAPTPKVSSAVSSSPTSLVVTFDQKMASTGLTTAGNYTFANCGALTNATGATITALNNNTQVLLTGLTVGTTGTCKVTVNTAIQSAAGSALTAATNSALFAYNTADTTGPQIVSMAPTNSNTVEIIFTENIDVSSITSGTIAFSPTLNVTGVVCIGNVCTVTTGDQSTTTYTATVTGVKDGVGNTTGSTSTTFTGDGKPYIVAIYPVDQNTVMVEWSEPIGNAASVDAGDYSISGVTITGAALYPSGVDPSRYVQLTINPALTAGTGYTLSVNNPTGSTDSTGNGTLGTVPNGGAFTGPTSTQAPLITSASSPSPTTVLVNFNEPLFNPITAGAFSFTGVGCALGTPTAATEIQAGVILLTIPGQAADAAACKVEVATANQVKDLAGNGNAAGLTHANAFAYTGTGS